MSDRLPRESRRLCEREASVFVIDLSSRCPFRSVPPSSQLPHGAKAFDALSPPPADAVAVAVAVAEAAGCRWALPVQFPRPPAGRGEPGASSRALRLISSVQLQSTPVVPTTS